MDKFCWLDIVILLPVIYGFIRGLMRGMITEIVAVVAIILGIIGAHIWGNSVWSCIGIFLLIAIGLRLVGYLLEKVIKAIKMDWINRMLGSVCGALKWAMIMLVLVFILGQADQQFHLLSKDTKQHSAVYKPALDYANKIWSTSKKHHS